MSAVTSGRRARWSRAAWTRALALALLLAPLAAREAAAHGVGMSQLQLAVDGPQIEGTWDLHLRDARMAIRLDTQLTGEEGWQDLRPHEAELRALLGRSLTMTADSAACSFVVTMAPMEWDAKMSTVRFHVAARCPHAPRRLGMHCDLLFDLDHSHRAYFSVQDARATSLGAFRYDERTVEFGVRQFDFREVVFEFIRDGSAHIGSGLDHILFLLALLLPAALVRDGADWSPRAGLRASAREVLKVVTAFTLAHSFTLCLSFFGIMRPPARLVEVGIALSVFAAAWNNLRPFLPGRAWIMAMGFGLVHGLGFAGALSNLSLPRGERVLALGAFNVGVELGQLAIVAVALPLLYAGSRRRWYPRAVMGVGSLVIAWLAVVWVLERSFSLSLFARR